MDENRKAELQKFFSVSAVIFLVVYLVFLMLSFFFKFLFHSSFCRSDVC